VVVFDVRSFVGEEISGIRAKRVFIIWHHAPSSPTFLLDALR
jgi:hypothetical protein